MLGRDIQSEHDAKLNELKVLRAQELHQEAATLPVKYALNGSLFGALWGYYLSQGCGRFTLRVSALGLFAGSAIGLFAKSKILDSLPAKKF